MISQICPSAAACLKVTEVLAQSQHATEEAAVAAADINHLSHCRKRPPPISIRTMEYSNPHGQNKVFFFNFINYIYNKILISIALFWMWQNIVSVSWNGIDTDETEQCYFGPSPVWQYKCEVCSAASITLHLSTALWQFAVMGLNWKI